MFLSEAEFVKLLDIMHYVMTYIYLFCVFL